MKRTWKIVLLLVAIAIVTGAVMFYRIWNMPARDVQEEKALVVNAQTLVDGFKSNEKNPLYLDKALEVTGEVSNIGKNQQGKPVITIKTKDPLAGVRCTMKDDEVPVTTGQTVTVKGLCTGYLMDVTLIDCYLVR